MHTILVVDDERQICDIIRIFLTSSGFKVVTANSAEEALSVLQKEKIDMMIMDKRMPGIGGIGLLREFKKRGYDLPVLILSGSYATPEANKEIMELGFNEVLYKPVDLNDILKEIKKRLKAE